ncbi:MAG: AMP-binding protein [Desulforhabdus sp.]|jgi:acyl-CoA synthetase (AMP-forming)/AMP-acid ligase II|nr:AMP-binding protein [Desulforhabdus sp.]
MTHRAGLIQEFLERAAAAWPEKTAVVHDDERLSYGELRRRAGCIGQWLLDSGLEKGDRVALLTDQPDAYIASYFGILAAGGIVVGLNTQTSERALLSVLSDCQASLVLSHERYGKYTEVVVEVSSVGRMVVDIPSLWKVGCSDEQLAVLELDPEDIGQIIYTSGTTGTPKGVMLRHRNLVANTLSTVSYLGLTERDSVMAILPFFYSYGNSVLLSHICVGGTLVVNQSFLYPKVILDQMVAEQVTGFSGVPSSFAILLNRSPVRQYRFPALRYLTQAGAAMAPALAGQLREVFPGVEIYIMYGQTEAAPRLSYLDPRRLVDKAGSIGKAIPGVELTVCRPDGSEVGVGEVGEIVAAGENIMAGYWRNPEETAKVLKSGKLWTGDLARVDGDGFLFIEGRKSSLIKSGSHRIAPKEIEEVIMECDGVHEVAVIGVPDDILGEKIAAFTVLKEGARLSGKDVIQHCRHQLPVFKVPQEVVFLAELPKTDTGKVKTGELLHI